MAASSMVPDPTEATADATEATAASVVHTAASVLAKAASCWTNIPVAECGLIGNESVLRAAA